MKSSAFRVDLRAWCSSRLVDVAICHRRQILMVKDRIRMVFRGPSALLNTLL